MEVNKLPIKEGRLVGRKELAFKGEGRLRKELGVKPLGFSFKVLEGLIKAVGQNLLWGAFGVPPLRQNLEFKGFF